MNRKIKFRCWDGSNMYCPDDNSKIVLYFNKISGWNIIPNKPNFSGQHILGESAQNEVFEMMQFTGLKDKNGVEIYEGDILSERWKTEVYKNEEGTYMVKFHTNPEINKPQPLFQYLKKREKAGCSETDCIIIGNIHKNPELL